ncbi:hypothetical protein E2562_037167 [Oryza meyeriana var. granulata]|uniref:Uncharacterized protein n=1 Tax=Oryza meyeriana var. granulata TaxID=110450 RepID=A0A6G1DAV1_9ORYZ|nr:hypothetical protein E2562_037167 [Oryza meyeriana var. granulata]
MVAEKRQHRDGHSANMLAEMIADAAGEGDDGMRRRGCGGIVDPFYRGKVGTKAVEVKIISSQSMGKNVRYTAVKPAIQHNDNTIF